MLLKESHLALIFLVLWIVGGKDSHVGISWVTEMRKIKTELSKITSTVFGFTLIDTMTISH
jgi:hypothetical protein